MNIIEFGVIVYEANKGRWEDSDFQSFVWKLSHMISEDDRPENIDFNVYQPEIKWKYTEEYSDNHEKGIPSLQSSFEKYMEKFLETRITSKPFSTLRGINP